MQERESAKHSAHADVRCAQMVKVHAARGDVEGPILVPCPGSDVQI